MRKIKNIYFYTLTAQGIGGTSRYVQNFISNILETTDLNVILISQDQSEVINEKFHISSVVDFKFKDIKEDSIFIITRESYFGIAKTVREHKPDIKIVGEIHAPLSKFKDINLHLEHINFIKVNTKKIQEDFIKIYDFKNTIYNYVPINHIEYKERVQPDVLTFRIKTRFDEMDKNLTLIFNILKELKKERELQLYLNGAGPSLSYYKYLIKFHELEDIVYLNEQNVPDNLEAIYLSASYAETFGYSLCEAILENGKVCTTKSRNDENTEVYEGLKSVKFMSDNVVDALEELKNFIDEDISIEDNINDFQVIKDRIEDDTYTYNYFYKLSQLDHNIQYENKLNKQYKDTCEKHYENKLYRTLLSFKKTYLPRKVPFETVIKNMVSTKEDIKVDYSSFKPEEKKVFVETFLGNCFSGEPKFMALEYQAKGYRVIVSCANTLVANEISKYNLEPVFITSKDYEFHFYTSKIAIFNGNPRDKLVPTKDQTIIQTWHGLPIKHMVYDLNDKKESVRQYEAFMVRMEKWTYLKVESLAKSKLLDSAFKLKENNVMIKYQESSLANYLLKNKDDSSHIIKLLKKYNLSAEKKYVLICPTWRSKRAKRIDIDVLSLIRFLPPEYEIIIKLHPNDSHLINRYSNINSRIHVYQNEFVDINELYLISHSLITDYSSSAFDFMLLDRLIIFNSNDKDDYENEIGFYYHLEDYINVVVKKYDTEELSNLIVKNEIADYSKFKEAFLEHNQGE